jgi:hypothetical protein
MEHNRDSEDEYYLHWLKYSGQMERRLKELQSTLEGKTQFKHGTVFCYDRGPGNYRVILQLKRRESDIGESVELVMVDGIAAGESGIKFRLTLNDYGPGTGVAYVDDPNLQGEFTADVTEIRRRIRELNLDKLASFVIRELQKVLDREPKGARRVLDNLLSGAVMVGVGAVLYSAVALMWVCPPLKRWIARKGRESEARQQSRSI